MDDLIDTSGDEALADALRQRGLPGGTGPQLFVPEIDEQVVEDGPPSIDSLDNTQFENDLGTFVEAEPLANEAIAWNVISFNIRKDFQQAITANLDKYKAQIKNLETEDRMMVYMDVIDAFSEAPNLPLRIGVFAQSCLINLEKDLLLLDLRVASLYLLYRLGQCDKISKEGRMGLGESLKNRMPSLDQIIHNLGITFEDFVLSKNPEKDEILRKHLRNLPKEA